jgi:hypothetical protein
MSGEIYIPARPDHRVDSEPWRLPGDREINGIGVGCHTAADTCLVYAAAPAR